MTSELSLWQAISLVVILIGAFFALFKTLVGQQIKHVDAAFKGQNARFDKIEASSREEASNWQRIERELMSLKADLPLAYVRRDDYIRGQSVLESKIDSLAIKIENAQLRGLFGKAPGEASK